MKSNGRKTRHFGRRPKTALGAGGRQFESARPDQWNHADTCTSIPQRKPAVDDFVDNASFQHQQFADATLVQASVFSESPVGHLHKGQVRGPDRLLCRCSRTCEFRRGRSRFGDDADRYSESRERSGPRLDHSTTPSRNRFEAASPKTPSVPPDRPLRARAPQSFRNRLRWLPVRR